MRDGSSSIFPPLTKRAGPAAARALHARVLKSGHSCDVWTRARRLVEDSNSMLSAYWRWGHAHEARRLFDVMRERKNVVTWTAMVSGLAKAGDVEAARTHFDAMPVRNTAPWNAMISGYALNGRPEEALTIFGTMTAAPNEATWEYRHLEHHDLGYARNGRPAEAIELFKTMGGKVRPDAITMVSVLSATAHLGSLELGGWVADCITENRIELGVSGLNSMIFMYASCGSVRDVERVFRGMPWRDAVSYNAFIGGLAAHGRASDALRLLDEMGARGVGPDRITYMGVLTACAHAGMVKEGKRVFEEIEAPMVDHYACMVDLLGRGERLEEVVGMVRGMPIRANAGVYGALLNASRVHKLVDVGEYAARELFELEPGELGNYLVLAGLYAGVNRRRDADRLIKTMEEKGMYKAVAGESWLEVGRKLRRFVAGERSRDWAEEVCGVSEGLGMISKMGEREVLLERGLI
ncbi:Pentatricopeptide repeat-containing protein [Acorus calamus]|uniref:Pentatricopeptide repeat-containing protein n=1 Tax=Acorus calamus TaxID=4465 RepID=A0AAV9FFP3_ACOCL|nr:Pentatricopeptide repeat-containing protein [Acorus calamus]